MSNLFDPITELGKAANQLWSTFNDITDGVAKGSDAMIGENPLLSDQAKAIIESAETLAEQLTQQAERGAGEAPEQPVSMDELADPATREEAITTLWTNEQNLAEHISSVQDTLDQIANIQQEASAKMDAALALRDDFGELVGTPVPFYGTTLNAQALGLHEDFEAISSALSRVADAAQGTQEALGADLLELGEAHDNLVTTLETFTDGSQATSTDQPATDNAASQTPPWDPLPESNPSSPSAHDTAITQPGADEVSGTAETPPWDPLPQSTPPTSPEPDPTGSPADDMGGEADAVDATSDVDNTTPLAQPISAAEPDPGAAPEDARTLEDFAKDLLLPFGDESKPAPTEPQDERTFDDFVEDFFQPYPPNERPEEPVFDTPVITPQDQNIGPMPIIDADTYFERYLDDRFNESEPILAANPSEGVAPADEFADPSLSKPTDFLSSLLANDSANDTTRDATDPFADPNLSEPADMLASADFNATDGAAAGDEPPLSAFPPDVDHGDDPGGDHGGGIV